MMYHCTSFISTVNLGLRAAFGYRMNLLFLTNMFLGFISIGLIINDEPLKAGVLILFAGAFDVFDGKIARKSKVRLIRDGVVVYTGQLSTLKRFKEDVAEVKKGFECGMSIENFNDIKVGDIIEGYDNIETKRELVSK